MARTAAATLQTIWDCRWGPPGYRLFGVGEHLQPEKLWVCIREKGRRNVTDEECESLPVLGISHRDAGAGVMTRVALRALAVTLRACGGTTRRVELWTPSDCAVGVQRARRTLHRAPPCRGRIVGARTATGDSRAAATLRRRPSTGQAFRQERKHLHARGRRVLQDATNGGRRREPDRRGRSAHRPGGTR